MIRGTSRDQTDLQVVRSESFSRASVAYVLMVLVPMGVAIYLLRVSHGGSVHNAPTNPSALASDYIGQLLLATTVVVSFAGLLGLACRFIGQSPVVGEMLAGIVLGPSALGVISPHLERHIFPAAGKPFLNVLAQVGVVFFMFLIGLEMPLTMLRRIGRGVMPVAHAAVAVPFVLGVGLALGLRGRYQPGNVRELPFVLFVALTVSVTAFPVLARILSDRNLIGSRLGTMGLASAGVADVTAWCALSLVIAEVRNSSSLGLARTVTEVALFSAAMWFGVRPGLAVLLRWLERRWSGPLSVGPFIAAFVLLCAVLTNSFGVHPIFGAFLAGMVMPRHSRAVTDFAAKTEGLTVWLLLPLFFATIGLQTRVQDVFSGGAAIALASVLLVAIIGKVAGTAFAARMTGENRNAAFSLGVMMNCRGLTELIVLNIGLSLGVIRSDLFSVLVVMTVVTTMMTDPLLRLLKMGRLDAETKAETSHHTQPPAHVSLGVQVD